MTASPPRRPGPTSPRGKPGARPTALPLKLLLLDVAGALLAALGLYELFAGGPPLAPPGLRFPGYGYAFLVVGTLMMWPLVRHLLGRGR